MKPSDVRPLIMPAEAMKLLGRLGKARLADNQTCIVML